jgi:hypothetical protein
MFHIPNWASLAFIVVVLGITIYASMRATRGKLPKKIEKGAEKKAPGPIEDDADKRPPDPIDNKGDKKPPLPK